jgi:hypothetical protein
LNGKANFNKREDMATIALKVPDAVKEKLQALADEDHRTLGNLVRLLLYDGAKVRFGIDFFKAGDPTKIGKEKAKK